MSEEAYVEDSLYIHMCVYMICIHVYMYIHDAYVEVNLYVHKCIYMFYVYRNMFVYINIYMYIYVCVQGMNT